MAKTTPEESGSGKRACTRTRTRTRTRGIAITLFGSFMWACSGVAGQILFQVYGVTASSVLPLCLIAAGITLLVVQAIRTGARVLDPFKDRRSLASLLLFAVLGAAGNQFAYFQTDYYSNAAWAIAMCYTSPIYIIVFYALRQRKVPGALRLVALASMIIGVVLISTHGELTSLVVSREAFAWGIISALTFSFCSIQPVKLMKRYGNLTINGWGFLIGGLVYAVVSRSWQLDGTWDATAFALAAFIAFPGTAGGFCLYLAGVQIIGSRDASMVVTTEVPTSALLTFLFMGEPLAPLDYFGFLLIVVAAVIAAAGIDDARGSTRSSCEEGAKSEP